jgi:heme/copper-type cytochrome/quinol oxidase subunit 3
MSAIPYTVEPRPDTGVNNVQLGIWLFLASEVMLFGGLFSAYFMLRAGAPAAWHPLRDHMVDALMLGTLNLVVASATLSGAASVARAPGRGLNRLRWPRFVRLLLLMSILASLAFCVWKWSEYTKLIAAHLLPSTSTQMASYFLLTGVHVLHVIGGTLAAAWFLLTVPPEPSAQFANRLAAAALYWYFVDLVWIAIFVLFYVV